MSDLLDRIEADPITGDDVRQLRDTLGLTRVEFGREIDAPVQEDRHTCRTVERWELGQSQPGASYRRRLRLLARAELAE